MSENPEEVEKKQHKWLRNPIEKIMPAPPPVVQSKEDIIDYAQYENYVLIICLMIFGLILFLTIVYIVVYCWKEAIKAKERYERDEYLKALEHHKKMVWAAKNQPQPEPV